MLLTARTLRRRAASGLKRRLARPLPRLLARILAVNLLPLLLLALGLLYLGRYEDNLRDGAVESLRTEGRIFANALAESAVLYSTEEVDMLAPELARQMVRRLVEITTTRTRLLDMEFSLLADTRLLVGIGGEIEVQPLPPPGEMEMSWGQLGSTVTDWVQVFRGLGLGPQQNMSLPPASGLSAEEKQIVRDAARGDPVARAYRLPDGQLQLLAAVPVQKYRKVLGVVLLTRSGAQIAASVQEVRVDILRLFALVLFITVLLSLYLAQGIATPLQRLALAAGALRRGVDKQAEIPDLSIRQDEIGDLSQALRGMTTALQARMDAIERFAADVAHELKNPLTSLRSALETLARIEDAPRRARLEAVMAEDIKRLDRLITDIASASRLDAELGRAENQLLDLRQLLASVVDLYTAMQPELTAPRIVLAGAPAPVWVEGAESRLMQVVQNLLDNALSFSPPGQNVTLSLRSEGPQAVMTVEDHGPGIPPGKEEAIFSRFYTERPSGEKFGQHSGLGLSIAKQIIDAHQGVIRAENRMDDTGAVRGARFTIRLPIADTP